MAEQELLVRIKVDAASSEKAVRDLQKQLTTADARLEKFGKTAANSSKRTQNFNRSLGMSGIQVGQFAGQVQGGQNALLAFSQQFADISMMLGPTGGVLGGLVAVGAAIYAITQSSDVATKDLEEMTAALEDMTKAQATVYLAEITKEIEDQQKVVDDLNRDLNRRRSGRSAAARTDEQRAKLRVEQQAELDKEIKRLEELETAQLRVNRALEELPQRWVEPLNSITAIGDAWQRAGELAREAEAQMRITNGSELGPAAAGVSGEFTNGSIFGQGVGTDFYGFQLEQEQAALAQRVEMNQEALDEMQRNEEIAAAAKQSILGSAGTAIVALMGKNNKAAIKVQKAFTLATAGISIATGIARAQELGYPANLAEMARVAAVGASVITTIKGSNIGSGTSAATVASGSASSPAVYTPPTPTQNVTTENTTTNEILDELRQFGGDELLPVEYTRRLVASIAEVERQGGV